jgi:DNA-binding transcriptional LysR family regulator
MDIEAIEIFVKVVQVGSFAEAARQLKVPTTTVSAKMARLEKSLDTTLIQRTTRRLNITPAGQSYYQRCLKALAELKAGEEELQISSKVPTGTLRITAAYDVAHSLLPPIIKKYVELYPKVKVDVVVTNRVVDLVAEGIDVAIRAGELKNSELIAKKFIAMSGGMFASEAYLKKNGKLKILRDLENHQYILFRPFIGKKVELTDGKKKHSFEPTGRISTDELQTIMSFADLDLGIALLPLFLAENHVKDGRLLRVLPNWSWSAGGKLSLVYPSQAYVTPRLRAFLDLAT